MRSTGKAHALRGLFALALYCGLGSGCFAIYNFEQEAKPCKTTADCPAAKGSCDIWSCVDGVCLYEEKPIPDGNPCTVDACENGNPTYPNAATGAPCGAGGKLTCDAQGNCVGCGEASDCDTQDVCSTWTCDIGVCTRFLKANGTFLGDPLKQDCKAEYCGVTGQIESRPYINDPKVDGNECTDDACNDLGQPVYLPKPDGTKCGMGCQTCTGGTCGACSPNWVCNMAQNTCVPLLALPNGSGCTLPSDCASGFCTDGVCCDSACDGLCMACNNNKTGQPDGVCSPITAGTDPEAECQVPTDDVCSGGTCQCNNNIKDGNEYRTDCGGNCPPCQGIWKCTGTPACEGTPNTNCCAPFCGGCLDFSFACKELEGSPCVYGVDAPKTYPLKLTNTSACNAQNSQACVYATCKCE